MHYTSDSGKLSDDSINEEPKVHTRVYSQLTTMA